MTLILNPHNNDASMIAALAGAIANFNVNLPFFRHTKPDPYAVEVGTEIKEIIAPTEGEQPRRLIILNEGPDFVKLFFGLTPPVVKSPATTPLDIESPFLIYPGERYVDDRNGG